MNSRLSASSWIFIPLIFLFFTAPGAVSYVFFHPDEKYYTDAALQMIEKNDFFTPYKADGSPRFNKPVLAYWALIGSYKLAGVSSFSSRILFWLGGALLVAVTFLMVRSLTKNRHIATVASLITAANPLLILSSSRSIPDILLALFLTLSAWGFMEMMVAEGRPGERFFWMAWLGAAFAFETKGIPAVAYAGISILYLLTNPWKRKKAGNLIHPAALITAFVVAVSWFVIMYRVHGSSYFSSFFADQVGIRISSGIMGALSNTFQGIGFLVAFTLPWAVIVFSKPKELKNHLERIDEKTKAVYGFCLAWAVLTIVMSGAVFKFYDRYLLPAIPVISVFFASVLVQFKTGFKNFVLYLFVGLNLIVNMTGILYTVFVATDFILVAGTLTSLLILIAFFLELFNPASKENAIANSLFLFYFNDFILLYPMLMPGTGEQLVSSLRREQISETDTIYVYGNIRTASAIRIQSHNQFKVVNMDTVFTVPEKPDNHFLVFRSDDRSSLDLANYKVVGGSQSLPWVSVDELPSFLQPGTRKMQAKGRYLIAKPRNMQKRFNVLSNTWSLSRLPANE